MDEEHAMPMQNMIYTYIMQSWNFQIFPEVQNCPSLEELMCNSFKLRCNFQVHTWFNILTWFGVQKPRSHFCTSFSRWITVTYFSSRKLRCDRRKFQDWHYDRKHFYSCSSVKYESLPFIGLFFVQRFIKQVVEISDLVRNQIPLVRFPDGITFPTLFRSLLFNGENDEILLYTWHDQGKLVTCRRFSMLRFFTNLKMLHFVEQTPLESDIWLQSHEQFINTENNIKQKNLNFFLANISKIISATSDSFHFSTYQQCSRIVVCEERNMINKILVGLINKNMKHLKDSGFD